MRTLKGTVLCSAGIALAIVALGIGDAIKRAENGWVMLAYTFLAIGVMCISLILCAFGVNAENEQVEQEQLKRLNRVPHHTNEWRDAQ